MSIINRVIGIIITLILFAWLSITSCHGVLLSGLADWLGNDVAVARLDDR